MSASSSSGTKRSASLGAAPRVIPARYPKRARKVLNQKRKAQGKAKTQKAPKKMDSSLWDATMPGKAALVAMPGTLGNYTPIHVSKLIDFSVLNSTERIIIMSFNAGGVAMSIVNGTGFLTYDNILFDELQTQPPTSCRPSRKTISLSNTTANDNLEGFVQVANIAEGVPLTLTGTTTGSITQAQFDAFKNAATTHHSSRLYSLNQLRSTHKFSTCFASAITATQWVNFVVGASTMQDDSRRNATSTLICYFSQVTQPQTLRVKVDEQISCRYPSDSLLNSVSTDYSRVVGEEASKSHIRQGAVPHDPPSRYPHAGRGGDM